MTLLIEHVSTKRGEPQVTMIAGFSLAVCAAMAGGILFALNTGVAVQCLAMVS